jgi:hypothetical protein
MGTGGITRVTLSGANRSAKRGSERRLSSSGQKFEDVDVLPGIRLIVQDLRKRHRTEVFPKFREAARRALSPGQLSRKSV